MVNVVVCGRALQKGPTTNEWGRNMLSERKKEIRKSAIIKYSTEASKLGLPLAWRMNNKVEKNGNGTSDFTANSPFFFPPPLVIVDVL